LLEKPRTASLSRGKRGDGSSGGKGDSILTRRRRRRGVKAYTDILRERKSCHLRTARNDAALRSRGRKTAVGSRDEEKARRTERTRDFDISFIRKKVSKLLRGEKLCPLEEEEKEESLPDAAAYVNLRCQKKKVRISIRIGSRSSRGRLHIGGKRGGGLYPKHAKICAELKIKELAPVAVVGEKSAAAFECSNAQKGHHLNANGQRRRKCPRSKVVGRRIIALAATV